MSELRCALVAGVICLVVAVGTHGLRADEIIFQDDFKNGLSDKWEIVGLKKDVDYRIRKGGLEVRVQHGKLLKQTPLLKIKTPFKDDVPVIVSVKVTPLDKFTAQGEQGGVYLLDEDGPVFSVRKEQHKDKLIYSPGEVVFEGKDGEEGDLEKYRTIIIPEKPEAGPLRILVDHEYAFFQVGPTRDDKYHNHFYSAIRSNPSSRGFALYACGAPEGAEHWVRFEDFKVFYRK